MPKHCILGILPREVFNSAILNLAKTVVPNLKKPGPAKLKIAKLTSSRGKIPKIQCFGMNWLSDKPREALDPPKCRSHRDISI